MVSKGRYPDTHKECTAFERLKVAVEPRKSRHIMHKELTVHERFSCLITQCAVCECETCANCCCDAGRVGLNPAFVIPRA